MKIDALRPRILNAKEVILATVSQDGCFPDGSYLTTNQIEFFHLHGQWVLPTEPRMDGVVRVKEGALNVTESNRLRQGEQVVYGDTEDGSQGIYVTGLPKNDRDQHFGFMQSEVSRERRVNYSALAQVLKDAQEGKIIWVLGPAVVHAGGIDQMVWLIQNGFVGALLGGNAIAVHDIEHAIFGTSLGMDDDIHPVKNAHRKHLEAINSVRELGSIEQAVACGLLTNGIMYQCVTHNIPYVLAASIRDDGPLPNTITDNLKSQAAMREQTIQASAVVMIASVLHSVATGNMTPTYRTVKDEILPIPVICNDTSEFAVTKLIDRGTSQAYPVVANASDFLERLVTELKRTS